MRVCVCVAFVSCPVTIVFVRCTRVMWTRSANDTASAAMLWPLLLANTGKVDCIISSTLTAFLVMDNWLTPELQNSVAEYIFVMAGKNWHGNVRVCQHVKCFPSRPTCTRCAVYKSILLHPWLTSSLLCTNVVNMCMCVARGYIIFCSILKMELRKNYIWHYNAVYYS